MGGFIKRAGGAERTCRQNPRCDTGSGNPAPLQVARLVLPEIPGGRYDSDALVDQGLGRQRQWIGPLRLVYPGTHRHLDNLDVVSLSVVRNPVHRRDDVADGTLAVLVENLQRQD